MFIKPTLISRLVYSSLKINKIKTHKQKHVAAYKYIHNFTICYFIVDFTKKSLNHEFEYNIFRAGVSNFYMISYFLSFLNPLGLISQNIDCLTNMWDIDTKENLDQVSFVTSQVFSYFHSSFPHFSRLCEGLKTSGALS